MKTARRHIQLALVDLLKTNITAANGYTIDLHGRVTPKQLFYDDVDKFPHICVVKGEEQRVYQPGKQAWGNVSFIIRLWTKDTQANDADEQLEILMGDIEYLLQQNTRLQFNGETTVDIRVDRITDDEGLMAHEGRAMGEMEIRVIRHLTMS